MTYTAFICLNTVQAENVSVFRNGNSVFFSARYNILKLALIIRKNRNHCDYKWWRNNTGGLQEAAQWCAQNSKWEPWQQVITNNIGSQELSLNFKLFLEMVTLSSFQSVIIDVNSPHKKKKEAIVLRSDDRITWEDYKKLSNDVLKTVNRSFGNWWKLIILSYDGFLNFELLSPFNSSVLKILFLHWMIC